MKNGTQPLADPHDHEEELHLRDLLNLVRRNLGLIGIVMAIIVGATAYVTWTAPPVYRAATSVHVDLNRPAMAELSFISELLRSSDVETEMALLRARSLAEETVDSLDLQVTLVRPYSLERRDVFSEIDASRITETERYEFRREGNVFVVTDSRDREIEEVAPGQAVVFNGIRLIIDPENAENLPDLFEVVSEDFATATEDLLDRLGVGQPFRDASVVTVSYEGQDRYLVREVPDMLTGLFIQRRGLAKKVEAVSTVEFLEEQIDDHQFRLQEAEESRLSFQQGQQVVDLRAEGAEQVRQVVEAQADKRELESRLSSLSSLLGDIEAQPRNPGERSPYRALAGYPTFMENQAVTELLSDLNQLESERTGQLELRTTEHPDVVALEEQILQLESQLYQMAVNHRQSLQTQVRSAEDRLIQFNTTLERIPENSVQLARLDRQIAVLEQIYTTLQSRLQEARVAQAVEPGDVRIVDPAVVPRTPIRPRKTRSIALALVFGLMVGFGVAAARDFLDETVHSRDDLVKIVGLPVLAMIPRMKAPGATNGARRLLSRNGRNGDRLVTRSDVGSPASEAYRAFRTNITFLSIDRPPRVIVVTSPGPSEGKSTCISNLAITLAQQDSKTLLVDCDLRRGIVHKIFENEKKEPGITNVLLGEISLEEAIRPVEVMSGKILDFLPTGTLPPNPSELLGSKHMESLVEALRERYKMVLLDSPPLNLVTDAAVLGAIVDSVILIARAGATDKGALRYARDQLLAVNAPLSGVVLNDVDLDGRGKYYGSGYGYRYDYRYYREGAEA